MCLEPNLINARLWLLAHQDDEVLGLHLNSRSYRNYVIYLTDGVHRNATYGSTKRAAEAGRAWQSLDPSAELNFFGTVHSIEDGILAQQVNASHLNELISICQDKGIREIVSLQLEGGHQDHDITSLLAEELSRRLSLKLTVFPAYRALHKRFPLYAVMSSTKVNNKSVQSSFLTRIKLARRSFLLMKNYQTQITTWIGLGPFILFKYLFGKCTYLSYVPSQEMKQSLPINLLYTIRNSHSGLDYGKFCREISTW